MGPKLEVWRVHLSMKKVKNGLGRENTGLQENIHVKEGYSM